MINKVITTTICILFLFQVRAEINIKKDNIKIIRDEWGVPHIFAPTDEEVAYGLAWATSEDDFKSIQENYLAIRSELGAVKGKDGAVLDFVTAFLEINDIVDEKIDQAFSPKFRKVLEYYCQGINDLQNNTQNKFFVKGFFQQLLKTWWQAIL